MNGIIFPVGLNDEDLGNQKHWGSLWVLQYGKVEICQSP